MHTLEHHVRDLVGRFYDNRSGFSERFALNRELTVTAIAGRNGYAAGVVFALQGSPMRGMLVVYDLGYGNPGGTDILAGTPLEQSEIAPLLTFLAEISEAAHGRLPAGFSWSSANAALHH